jgi:predicted tellurium resistance membrane protein TerC
VQDKVFFRIINKKRSDGRKMDNLFAGMFTPEWLAALSGILLLDLLLSGDNAILIALACKNLPKHNRRKAILIGGFGAVLIRIVCTLFATGLLAAPYIECIGGAALLYIAVRLVTEHNDGGEEDAGSQPGYAGGGCPHDTHCRFHHEH